MTIRFPVRFMIVGSATYDIVRIHEPDTEFFGHKPHALSSSYEAVGGGAMNMFDGLKRLAVTTGLPFRAEIFTKVGRPDTVVNIGRKPRRNTHAQDVYDAVHGHSLHDMCRHQKYVVPRNIVIARNDRGISKDPSARDFGDVNTPLDPDTFETLESVAQNIDVALLQVRYPEVVNAACEALPDNATVITDFDVKSEERARLLEPALRRSDIIIAPGESVMPGMAEKDPDRLFEELKQYERSNGGRAKLIAVSNGGTPVRYFSNGREGSIPINQVAVVDNLGTGDRRDAFLAVGLAMGMDPERALHHATRLAEFIVQFPDTEWAEGQCLRNYLIAEDLFNHSRPLTAAPTPAANGG